MRYISDIEIFSLFEYLLYDQIFERSFNCSRSEVSFSFCNYCILSLLDNALVFVHQLIITLNLCFLKILFDKRHQRFLMLRRIIGLVLTFFMEVKQFMQLLNQMSKDV